MAISRLKAASTGGVYPGDFSNTATGSGSGYKYVSFTTGTTALTVPAGGLFDLLAVGGGASGASGLAEGGDAGQLLYVQGMYLPAGSYTVTIGAGGTSPGAGDIKGNRGSDTIFGSLTLRGGRGGRPVDTAAGQGANQSISITGAAVTYAAGGLAPGGGAGAAGTANTGNGGQGGGSGGQAGGTGGSGIVIVRVNF